MHKLLFVCLGNICRSPAAEGIMREKVEKAGLTNKFLIDSAATSSYNLGDPPDTRMTRHSAKREFYLQGKARKVQPADFVNFDLILAMDRNNYRDLTAVAKNTEEKAKIKLMCDFCVSRKETEVPDPYYGGAEGFELVLDILEDACSGLLSHLKLS